MGSSALCDVAVLVCRGLASLDVLLVDEHLDALFDHADTWVEPGFGLIDDLHTETSKTVIKQLTKFPINPSDSYFNRMFAPCLSGT